MKINTSLQHVINTLLPRVAREFPGQPILEMGQGI